jgi:hypothetical protein
MFVALPGFIGSVAGGPPPPGTLLSSHCSGYSAQNAGPETYTDALGVEWTERMFSLWEELADGYGGSYWSGPANNSSDVYSSCWYADGYCISNDSGDSYMNWEGCGSSGNFGPVSWYSYKTFADGFGGTYTDNTSGFYDPPSAGTIIYQSGEDNCCTVYYDGVGGYYINDTCGGGCPAEGTFLYDGCASTSGTDAAGDYYSGAWAYGSFYADGTCGEYFVLSDNNVNGCYFPAGWKFDYNSGSSSLYYEVTDSESNVQTSGDFTYSSWWSTTDQADGSGGTSPASGGYSASYGDTIASGTYYDNGLAYEVQYYVYYDGAGGYYINRSPV